MIEVLLRTIAVAVVALAFQGCRKLDTDVSSEPRYNFSSFAGSEWKTKNGLMIVDATLYTGSHVLMLVTPNSVNLSRGADKILDSVPAGSHLKIETLRQDDGEWGGYYVTAELMDGPYAGKVLYLDARVLAKNEFIWPGWSNSNNWGVDPEWLEK